MSFYYGISDTEHKQQFQFSEDLQNFQNLSALPHQPELNRLNSISLFACGQRRPLIDKCWPKCRFGGGVNWQSRPSFALMSGGCAIFCSQTQLLVLNPWNRRKANEKNAGAIAWYVRIIQFLRIFEVWKDHKVSLDSRPQKGNYSICL